MATPHFLPPTPPTVVALPLRPRSPVLSIVPLDRDRATAPLEGEDWGQVLSRIGRTQDRGAFARLFAHFAPRVKSYLMRGGSSEAQSEECVQEAFAAIWRKASLFDPDQAAASTWIYTIARNLRIDAQRRQRLDGAADEPFEFDALAADQPPPDERLHAARLEARVRRALEQLPPEQAQVLRLSYYEDQPHALIARELGIPLGTVKSRMRLAVAHLRRLLTL